MAGKVGSIGNKTGTEMVGEFGDLLGDTSVYPEFVHLLNVLMGSFSKSLIDEFSRDIVACDHGTW